MICRVCGCSENSPCFTDPDGQVHTSAFVEEHFTDGDLELLGLVPCSWIESDLCSACIATPAPPLLFDAYGHPVMRGAP
jgi:hypothetical protein